jgi:hypothetical protein
MSVLTMKYAEAMDDPQFTIIVMMPDEVLPLGNSHAAGPQSFSRF